jgi:hypothetical protein
MHFLDFRSSVAAFTASDLWNWNKVYLSSVFTLFSRFLTAIISLQIEVISDFRSPPALDHLCQEISTSFDFLSETITQNLILPLRLTSEFLESVEQSLHCILSVPTLPAPIPLSFALLSCYSSIVKLLRQNAASFDKNIQETLRV